MKVTILEKVDSDDGLICEIVDCPNPADYYVEFDNDRGFICKSCCDEENNHVDN